MYISVVIKIYIENLKQNMSPYNGKGKFICRLSTVLPLYGVHLVSNPNQCDINFRMNALPSTRYGKRVVRLDNVAYSNETLHRRVRNNGIVAKALEDADGVVFQSQLSFENCIRCLGVVPVNHMIIPNGVNQKDFQHIKNVYHPNYGKRFLVACQVMHPMRRIIQVIDCWKTANIDNGKLTIVYDKKRTGYSIDHLSNKNINIVQVMNQDKLNKLIHGHDAVLLTTYMDSCPNLASESLACGVPIVTCKTNGINEFVDCTIIDDAKCVDNIVNWENPPAFNSNDLIKVFKGIYKRNVKYPEKLDIHNIAKQYKHFFEEVLND